MRYIVVGDTAILSTRGAIEVGDKPIDITVEAVPDGTCLTFIHPNGEAQFTTDGVISGKTSISSNSFKDEGRYTVTVCWTETKDGQNVSHSAIGTSLLVSKTSKGIIITPAPLTTACELENMWKGIVNTLDELLPYITSLKYGADVI